MRRVEEDQVDIGVRHDLVGNDGSGVGSLPLHGGKRDDLHARELLHLVLETFLDIEAVGVCRIAQHLQDLAFHVAVLLLQQALHFARRHLADLDGSGDRGEVRWRRGDLAVEFDDRNARRAGLLDRRLQGVEVDGGEHDGRRLQQDRVVHLALLQVGLVVGVERHDLIANIAQELLESRDRFCLELVQKRGHHVIDLALGLGVGRAHQPDGGDGER